MQMGDNANNWLSDMKVYQLEYDSPRLLSQLYQLISQALLITLPMYRFSLALAQANRLEKSLEGV